MSAGPGASQAATGLPPHLQVLERGWLSSNNIVFTGPDGTAIVDTGYVSHSAQTVALVERCLEGRPLDMLLNTHLHSDHCGGNAALQAAFPAVRILVPDSEFDAVRRWDDEALSYRATGQACPRFNADAALVPGDEITLGGRAWQIHAAPGHDPHSVILFEPASRTLISADALWENGFGVVFPELIGEPSFDEVAATLDVIEQLRPLRVVPGHGRVFGDVEAALVTARSRLDAWVRGPERHARHALKVLLKFKLMELRQVERAAWGDWLRRTPYVKTIRARFFAGTTIDALSDELLSELAKSGVLEMDAEVLRDR